MKLFADIFSRTPVDSLIDEQLYEAQRKLVEYEAAAEHHAAMTDMYRRRVQRLMSLTSSKGEETAAIELQTGKRLRAKPYIRLFRSVPTETRALAKQ